MNHWRRWPISPLEEVPQEGMMSYKSDYDASANRAAAKQTKKVVNQNMTTNNQQVQDARNLEASRRKQGKPKARTP
jgi:hypothetical protein